MKNFSPETRKELAQSLKSARRIEKNFIIPNDVLNKEKRDRSATTYIDHLQGLQATLEYVKNLPVKTLIDLGAGSSRAIAEIAHSEYGKDIKFTATGIVPDSEINKNIGQKNYRLTPAEIMKGFSPSSVGGFISIYGPFEHSNHLSLVLQKIDELLTPKGILKLCITKNVPSSELNEQHFVRCEKIEAFLKKAGYGFALKDWDIVGKRGTNRTFLGIKPGDKENTDLYLLASQIMEKDFKNIDKMKSNLNIENNSS